MRGGFSLYPPLIGICMLLFVSKYLTIHGWQVSWGIMRIIKTYWIGKAKVASLPALIYWSVSRGGVHLDWWRGFNNTMIKKRQYLDTWRPPVTGQVEINTKATTCFDVTKILKCFKIQELEIQLKYSIFEMKYFKSRRYEYQVNYSKKGYDIEYSLDLDSDHCGHTSFCLRSSSRGKIGLFYYFKKFCVSLGVGGSKFKGKSLKKMYTPKKLKKP